MRSCEHVFLFVSCDVYLLKWPDDFLWGFSTLFAMLKAISFSPLRSRHRHKARQTKEKRAWLHLYFTAVRDRSPVPSKSGAGCLTVHGMLEPALKETCRTIVLSPVWVAHVRLSANRSVTSRSVVMFLLLNFVVWGIFLPVLNKLCCVSKSRWFTRRPPLMNAAVTKRHFHTLYLVGWDARQRAGERAAETISSRRRSWCFIFISLFFFPAHSLNLVVARERCGSDCGPSSKWPSWAGFTW